LPAPEGVVPRIGAAVLTVTIVGGLREAREIVADEIDGEDALAIVALIAVLADAAACVNEIAFADIFSIYRVVVAEKTTISFQCGSSRHSPPSSL